MNHTLFLRRAALMMIGVVVVAAVSLSARADRQILLAFDATGHHVLQVNEIPDRRLPGSAQQDTRCSDAADMNSLQWSLKSGQAVLVVSDEQDRCIEVRFLSDPRIAKAPSHVFGHSAASLIAESEGAWLVSVPDHAHSLVFMLAEHSLLSLGSEQWTFNLPL